MARAAAVLVLALGVGALTPPPAPKTPVTGRQAVVKERKQLLPPTVAPLVVETVPDGPLLADAPPLLDEGGNNCFLSLTTAWRPVTGVLGAGGGVRAAPPSAKATTKAARAIWTLSGARDRRARSNCELAAVEGSSSDGRTLRWTAGATATQVA